MECYRRSKEHPIETEKQCPPSSLLSLADSVICRKSYDFPDEVSPVYHMTLEDGNWVTLRWDQVVKKPIVYAGPEAIIWENHD